MKKYLLDLNFRNLFFLIYFCFINVFILKVFTVNTITKLTKNITVEIVLASPPNIKGCDNNVARKINKINRKYFSLYFKKYNKENNPPKENRINKIIL